MEPGDLVADRFAVEHLVGSGGMGRVYLARDRASGEHVALKVLAPGAEDHLARFTAESEVLAELRHSAIVGYVAHGVAADGTAFLAMEWLEGETLGHRLVQRGLTLSESLRLGQQVAEALAVLHARGIVHRDLKPANLFLVDGDVARLKLLDFGIARRVAETAHELTATGAALGTPSYMSPEQARGDREIDARSDLFALGSVLFKCLTGHAAFPGRDPLTVLFNVVFSEARRVRDEDPAIPVAVDALVARLLAKDPERRPADAAAVARELEALAGDLPSGVTPRVAPRSIAGLTTAERRVVCLVMARRAAPDESEDTQGLADLAGLSAALRAEAQRHEGLLEMLADGTLLIALSGVGAPTDHAARAARCALAVQRLLPGAPVALVAGRGVVSAQAAAEPSRPHAGTSRVTGVARSNPLGALIGRGHALLGVGRAAAIRLDAVTSGLLDPRFEVVGDAAGLVLRRELDAADGARTLLGRPTPCVGRDGEIAGLVALFHQACDEDVARVALVTAPAGVGKSRVLHEALRRIADSGRPALVLAARGDPVSAGSPLGMVASALRRGLGVRAGEREEVQRDVIAARVRRHVAERDAARVTEFLGAIVGVRPETESVELRGARQNAVLMGDQMRRAWVEFLAAECAAQPVVLVLEDLHWGDLATVKFVDAALRALEGSPLVVIAAARPEVHESFPGLWRERNVQEVRLGQLGAKSAARLVRAVLPDVGDATVERLVARAAGHAFYLEELIRAVAEGNTDTLPETVLAMVAARLDRLEPEARRVLRAASVYGEAFGEAAVAALLGGGDGEDDPTLAQAFAALVDAEILVRRPGGTFPGAGELVFRHNLVREAAYAMLTDADRELGHRLAGDWLERAGERDALLLAEHFERGGVPGRAVPFYRDAAQQALASNDYDAVVARADRGVACGAAGELLGALKLAQTEAHRSRGDLAQGVECATQAIALFERGSAGWCLAASEVAMLSLMRGEVARGLAVADDLFALFDRDTEPGPLLEAVTRVLGQLIQDGDSARARAMVDRIESLPGPLEPQDLGRIHVVASLDAVLQGDLGAYKFRVEASIVQFERAGDQRAACSQRGALGYANMALGAFADAEAELREAIAIAERVGVKNVAAHARHNLGLTLARMGKLAEARRVEEEAVHAFAASGVLRVLAASRSYLAMILALSGELDEALREADAALVDAGGSALPHVLALGTRAHVLLQLGRPAEALAATREAEALIASVGGLSVCEALVHLAHAEALAQTGEAAAAREAARHARARVLAQADSIKDPALRMSFLQNVPENARTLQRAAEWLDGPSDAGA